MSHQASAKGSTVSFHDISYHVFVRKFPWSCPTQLSVLSNLSGIMLPGMNAIMGPTGCGKSSLLDVLAGRKNPQQLSGYVLLDAQRRRANVHRHLCGYVVQDNIAMDTLTVRENIAFSAALRLPRQLTAEERNAKVTEVIEELELTSVADHLLGTTHVRGVSGGERKRTCIGIELVKNPRVLYLDEPTTGLDAHTAGSVMKTLKRLAKGGRTIVFSIHQPKYSIYRLFDRLTLLSNGQIVYHGPSGQFPIQYFRGLGYVIEGYNNPADFLMDTLHGEVIPSSSGGESGESPHSATELRELSADGIVSRFVNFWLQSDLYRRCQLAVTEIARSYEAQLLDTPHSVSPSAVHLRPFDQLVSGGVYRRGSGDSACGPLASAESLSASENSLHQFSVPKVTGLEDIRVKSVRNTTFHGSEGAACSTCLDGSPEIHFCAHSQPWNPSNSFEDDTPSEIVPCPPSSPDPIGVILTSHPRHRRYKRFHCTSGCTVKRDSRSDTIRMHQLGASPYPASFCRQLCVLMHRQCLSMVRDYHSMFAHFIIQFIICVFLGTIYFNLDSTAESGIQNRTGLFFFTCMQLLFINGSLVDAFLRERVIFRHEISAGVYRISSYLFAKIITEVLPVKALPALLFLPITYILAGLRHSWRAFLFWELTLTLLTITASGIAFSVSTMVTDARLGGMLLSMFFVLLMITSGFLINVLSLGPWLSWLRHLSVLRLAMNVLMINELVGVRFCPSNDTSNSTHPVYFTDSSAYQQFNYTGIHTLIRPEENIFLEPPPCILGEQYLETQAIDYIGAWAIWKNEFGIVGVFLLALLNGYMYLRLMKKYT